MKNKWSITKTEPISLIYYIHLDWETVKKKGIFKWDLTAAEQIKWFFFSAKPSMKVNIDAVHEVTFDCRYPRLMCWCCKRKKKSKQLIA